MSAILCLLAAAAFSLGDISAVAYEKSIVSAAEGWKNWGLHGVRDFAKALSKVSGETGFSLSEIRSEGKASMWGGSRLSVRCDMTVSAPRNRRPDARKLLSGFLERECRTAEPVDWSHVSRIMSVQDFSGTAKDAEDGKKFQGGVRLGF